MFFGAGVVVNLARMRWSPRVLSLRKAVSGSCGNISERSGSSLMIEKLSRMIFLMGTLWGWYVKARMGRSDLFVFVGFQFLVFRMSVRGLFRARM